MGWFRASARSGASLALLALALNLAFAFGHHHFDEAEHKSAVVNPASDGDRSGGADEDHHGTPSVDTCLVCVVVAAPPLAASPPQLPSRQFTERAAGQATASFEARDDRRPGFEPRAPPRG